MRYLLGLLKAVVFLWAASAFAQYPSRPITLIVAYSPGGGTDLIARAISPYIEKYLGGGARIVIVHRPGAGGEVGFAALQNSAPDGYTIGFVNTPPVVTIPIERKAQFSPDRFDYLGNIIDDPCNFSVHADMPVRNLKELADHARANPGKVSIATTGVGSDDHLAILKFERVAKVKMTHIHYKGSSDMRNALASRTLDVISMNIGEAIQAQKGGFPIRNLAQFSPARTNLAPDLPTGREQGFDFELSSLRGMAAPKGMPPEILQRLRKAIADAVADAEFQALTVKFFAPLRYLTPAQHESHIRDADVEYRQLWKELPWADK
jgi:tripartite-type tricarboxylate transporter receptor subunit TctC